MSLIMEGFITVICTSLSAVVIYLTLEFTCAHTENGMPSLNLMTVFRAEEPDSFHFLFQTSPSVSPNAAPRNIPEGNLKLSSHTRHIPT